MNKVSLDQGYMEHRHPHHGGDGDDEEDEEFDGEHHDMCYLCSWLERGRLVTCIFDKLGLYDDSDDEEEEELKTQYWHVKPRNGTLKDNNHLTSSRGTDGPKTTTTVRRRRRMGYRFREYMRANPKCYISIQVAIHIVFFTVAVLLILIGLIIMLTT